MGTLSDLINWLSKYISDKLTPLEKEIEEKTKNAFPAGMICWFYIKDTETVGGYSRIKAPDGWVVCDGRSYTTRTGTSATAPNLCTARSTNDPTIYKYICATNIPQQVGVPLAPSLPNITGKAMNVESGTPGGGHGDVIAPTGAFGTSKISRAGEGWGKGLGANDWKYDYCYGFEFNASNSSGIYKNGATVQPASIQLVPCMKI